VTCDEAEALTGEAIDRMLSTAASAEFHRHLTHCAPCRRAFELELVIRNTVRDTLPHRSTPHPVREFILGALIAEEEADARRGQIVFRLWGGEYRLPVAAGAILAAAAMIAVVLGIHRMGRHPESRDLNIVQMAEENLAKIRTGALKPTVMTAEPQEIRRYFQQRGAGFASAIDPPQQGEWYGGILTEHDGIPMAHLVCKLGGELLYVFEVREEDVRRDEHLRLPIGVADGIARNGWFSESGDGEEVVFWRENETLCAAASTMRRQDLLSLLAAREN
jgi:anti-sigma factor RsiW